MDEYVKTLLCRALMEMAGEYALFANRDPDLIVEQALLDASFVLKRFGEQQVKANIEKHHPRLYKKTFHTEEASKNLWLSITQTRTRMRNGAS